MDPARRDGAWALALACALAAAAACSDDSSSSGTAGAAGSAGDAGDAASGSGGDTGSAGTGGSAGSAGDGGTEICPGSVAPEIVSELPGATFPGPSGYQGGATPQLDLSGPDVGWTWNDPHVLRVGGEHWMYASATQLFDFPVRLYRLRSSDGASWSRDPKEPILEPGTAGAWDAGGVETPSVVHFGGRYHLFYSAYPYENDDPKHSVLDYAVGHATSCDGVSWQRVGTTPLVAPSGQTDSDPSNDWYAFVVAEPGAVVRNGELYVYFTAVGTSAKLGTSLQVIGLVRSMDGQSWSAPELVLEPDQAQYPRIIDPGPPVDGWVGYSTPSAMVLGGEVHLFVDVAYDPDEASWKQIRLHHARSADGRTGFIQDPAPLASAGDFPWAVDEIRSPQPIVDGKTLRLYFAGHELDGNEPNHFAIGMMTSPLVP